MTEVDIINPKCVADIKAKPQDLRRCQVCSGLHQAVDYPGAMLLAIMQP